MAAVQTAEYDPTDLDGRERRDKEREQLRIALELERREDLVWLLSGRRGRRKVRRLLAEGGFSVARDEVGTVFDRHHGQMAFSEGYRVQALNVLWPLMRLLASGGLPFESFQALMQETDE